MKYYKQVTFIVIVLFFIGCKTKQKIVEKVETNKSDTLIVKSQTVETPPILTSLNILEICDTVTGKPKEFKYKYVVEKDTFEISLLKNELNIYANRLKQLRQKNDSLVKIRDTKTEKSTVDKTVKFRVPFKYWVFLIVSLLSNIYFIYSKFRNKLPF